MRLDEIFNLMELRRNSQVNTKISAILELEKYANDPEVYVSFVSDVGVNSHADAGTKQSEFKGDAAKKQSHNVRGSKIGINPRSDWDTPIGIYAYPIDYALDKNLNVPFAGNKPYIYVFRSVGTMLNAETYSVSDLDADCKKIIELCKKMVPEGNFYNGVGGVNSIKDIIREAKDTALVETPAGIIWNVTRKIAIDIANIKKLLANDINRKNSLKLKQPSSVPPKISNFKAPVIWNKLFRDLGYAGAVNYKDEGIIHDNEPTQAVFFSIKSIKPITTVHNIKPQKRLSRVEIIAFTQGLYMKMLYADKLTPDLIIAVLKRNHMLTIPTSDPKVPKHIIEWMNKSWHYLLVDCNLTQLLKQMTLDDNQIIEIIKELPDMADRLPTSFYSKKILEYMLDHLDIYFNENYPHRFAGGVRIDPQLIVNLILKEEADKSMSFEIYRKIKYFVSIAPSVYLLIIEKDVRLFMKYFYPKGLGYNLPTEELEKCCAWIIANDKNEVYTINGQYIRPTVPEFFKHVLRHNSIAGREALKDIMMKLSDNEMRNIINYLPDYDRKQLFTLMDKNG
jgi:hypothetical protein